MVGRIAKIGIALVVGLIIIFLLAVGSMVIYVYMFMPVWTEQLPVVNATGHQVTITNYRNATNITYANLTAFLESDQTEDALYVYPTYTCADFAIALHDNAEAHGIKSGIVCVDFEGKSIGHAFNVFPTDDKGLIYVDATGMNATQLRYNLTPVKAAVYLVNGSKMGEIAFNQTGGNFDYSFYLDRAQRIDEYKDEIAKWDAENSLYDADYIAWNIAVTQLNTDYEAYNADLAAYQSEVRSYNAQMDAHNAAVAQYNAGNKDVYIPPVPEGRDRLQAWKNKLDSEYIAYGNRANDIRREGASLKSRYDALYAASAALKSREEAKWITYNPVGIVDSIGIYW